MSVQNLKGPVLLYMEDNPGASTEEVLRELGLEDNKVNRKSIKNARYKLKYGRTGYKNYKSYGKIHRARSFGIRVRNQTHNREYDAIYKNWRMQILERDSYTCQMPDCRKDIRGLIKGKFGGALNVHHIRKWAHYPELRYDVMNGICLCADCHKRIKGFEEIYESIFITIVNVNTQRKMNEENSNN